LFGGKKRVEHVNVSRGKQGLVEREEGGEERKEISLATFRQLKRIKCVSGGWGERWETPSRTWRPTELEKKN